MTVHVFPINKSARDSVRAYLTLLERFIEGGAGDLDELRRLHLRNAGAKEVLRHLLGEDDNLFKLARRTEFRAEDLINEVLFNEDPGEALVYGIRQIHEACLNFKFSDIEKILKSLPEAPDRIDRKKKNRKAQHDSAKNQP